MAHVQLLIDAVRDDNLPSCERIVQKCGKDLIVTPQPRENGLTALHVAARCNHVLILKWFLLQGINTNIQDSVSPRCLAAAADWLSLLSPGLVLSSLASVDSCCRMAGRQ
eukprot:m.173448 g.173448  ORF g.173448 m.173448 type:complete len:110 (-) comp53271_c0_seq1:570-899(-)